MVDPNRNIHLSFARAFGQSDNSSGHGSKKPAIKVEDDDDEDGIVYCICRTSDTNRFMIGCDNCNEWYHGDCISITEEYAKKIKKFYCLMCRDKDPSLEIQFKEKKAPVKKEKPPPKPVEEVKVPVRVDMDSPFEFKSLNNEDSDDEDEDGDDDDDEDDFVPQPGKKKGGRGVKRKLGPDAKKGKRGKRKDSQKVDKGVKKTKVSETKVRKGHRKTVKEPAEVDDGPRHCYGPGCRNSSRKGSKYCSDECGGKLATNRINEILLGRIRQWQSTPSVADVFSQQELDSIRQEQQKAKRILEELDLKQQLLEELINKSKSIPIISEDEASEETEGESELSTYCVTCGHEVSYRLAMRHMERCFNKYESQTSFGSAFKTKIEGVFCDVYNPHQKSFCKRLRVMCPEHSKEPKIADDEVCGCPLVANVFEYSGGFCRIPRKKCIRHYGWTKLRRAEIDMERVQQWFKLEELFEKEQKIRFTMANRGGVLALMLHQTITHD